MASIDIPLVTLPSTCHTSTRHHDAWAFLVAGIVWWCVCILFVCVDALVGRVDLIVLIGLVCLGGVCFALAIIHFLRVSSIHFDRRGLTLFNKFAGSKREQYIPYLSYRGLRYRRLGLTSNRGDFYTHQVWLEHRCKAYSVLLFSQREPHPVKERLQRYHDLLGVPVLEADMGGSELHESPVVLDDESNALSSVPDDVTIEQTGDNLRLSIRPDTLHALPCVMYVSFPLLLFFCGLILPELSSLLWGVAIVLMIVFGMGAYLAKVSYIEVIIGKQWRFTRRYPWGKGHVTILEVDHIADILVTKDPGEPGVLSVECANGTPIVVASHKHVQVLIWIKKILDRARQSRHASRPHDRTK